MHETLPAKVDTFLGENRLPGEQVTHAVPVYAVGGAHSNSRPSLLGRLLFAGQGDVGEIYGTELRMPQHAIIALTSHRLLIFQQNAFRFAPKALVHDVPFARLSWMRQAIAGHGPAHVQRVTLGVTDAAVLRWEYPRLNIPDGQVLNDELRRKVPVGDTL
ncbi:hypothetical protein [Streptomyces sp. SID13031]|uniref:hypothetical protein n=1 Tax=Streptomyces sp. SID13031 TaxID=2706046 RepID=UPI0013CD0B05|nr:hypothetical protein [Streptomyces sp. SID13031]NEA33746.1 hypothetical protein [Streptomyces sp. SID13031]